MRLLSICLVGAFLALSGAASAAVQAPSAAPTAVHQSVEQARWVQRCRVVRVWRNGPRGRHLVPVRRCRRVNVR